MIHRTRQGAAPWQPPAPPTLKVPVPTSFPNHTQDLPIRIWMVDPSSASGRGTLAASCCALSAKRTAVAAWSGSGTSRLAAITYASPIVSILYRLRGRGVGRCGKVWAQGLTCIERKALTPMATVLAKLLNGQL